MRAAPLGLALLATFAVAAARAQGTDELLRELANCARRLDPELDVGFGRVAQRCPALGARLAASRWASALPAGWNRNDSELSAGGLAELATLIERELAAAPAAAPAAAAPSPALLAQVLQELGAARAEPPGIWSRIKSWLRSLFGPRHEGAAPDGWSNWLRRLGPGEAALRVLGYAALALVVALAVVIIANELRAAGVLRARARREPRPLVPGQAEGAPGAPGDLGQVALLERPALLLRRVAEALTRARRLPPAGSLTARELTQAAHFESPADRERLQRLAAVAERARFSAQPPDSQELEPALAGGASLLADLARPGGVR